MRRAPLPEGPVTITTDERTRRVPLGLTDYQLSALRLLVQADIERTDRDNPYPYPGTDPRHWPTAMRAIAAQLDRRLVDDGKLDGVAVASAQLAQHYLNQAPEHHLDRIHRTYPGRTT